MSLSRPIKFPLLKLPLLCIESVIRSCDSFDILCFALISKRTRQIVRHVKPLIRIRIFLSGTKRIEFDRKSWDFRRIYPLPPIDQHRYLGIMSLVLQNNAIPLYTRKTDYGFKSFTDENECFALKIAMEFLNEIFKCQVERVEINEDNFPILEDVGVKSTVNLCIDHSHRHIQSQKLSLLLENLEVTDTCTLWVRNAENDFYCDPKLFKCKKLVFSFGSATWVTLDVLMKFEVPQLNFTDCPFSVEDIVSFVTQWFQLDDKKFEYLNIYVHNRQIPLVPFQTEFLNPLPFNGRNRVPSEPLFLTDFSAGLELRRKDGLVATIHVNNGAFLFYVWHNQ